MDVNIAPQISVLHGRYVANAATRKTRISIVCRPTKSEALQYESTRTKLSGTLSGETSEITQESNRRANARG